VNRFRTIAVTAVAGFVLVACGPAASSSSGGPSSEASQAAPSQAQASQGGPGPSFTEGAAADLEALIPDTVGDLTIQKESMAGSEYLTAPGSDPSTVKFVEDLGVSPSDISIAVGFGFSADASAPPRSLIMFVVRAAGADTSRLVSVFKDATDAERDTPLEWTSDNVGGKSVEKAVDGDSTIYLYAKNDILIFVSGDPDSITEVLSGLP
jgi:hypothetical protein